MAGGEGRRLRPITEKMPKPLVPINGKPAISLILRLLYQSGIKEAAVTVGYLADKLISELGDECEGVRLKYFKETTPLGTAGGVLQTKDFIGNDDFVVMSGDSVTEIEISAMADRRKELNAEALLVLTHCENPGEYGVVLRNQGDRVIGFSEKPSLSGTFSDTVNTGIYLFSSEIFKRIPENISYDFGKDLFPTMLRNGIPIYASVAPGYWCDIGDSEAYYEANMRLTGGGNSIGKGCITENATVYSSVLMDGCRLGVGCHIDSAILCEGVTVGDGARIEKGSVIGAGSVIGKNAILKAGTKLPSNTVIPDGKAINGGIVFHARDLLGKNGLVIPKNKLSVSLAEKIGSSLALACRMGRIGIMNDGDDLSSNISSSITRGCVAAGGEVISLGFGFEAQAAYAAVLLGLDAAIFLRTDKNELGISLFDSNGLYPKRSFERSFISAMSSEDPPHEKKPKDVLKCTFEESFYLPFITKKCRTLDGFEVNISEENAASRLLKRAILDLGGKISETGLRLIISEDGFSLSAEQERFSVDDWHIKALILKYLPKDAVSLPISYPSALFSLCRGGCQTYSRCPTDDSEDEIRKKAPDTPEMIHACIAARELIGLLAASGKRLFELSKNLPRFFFNKEEYFCSNGVRLSIISELGAPDGDGVKTVYSRGYVRIIPSRSGYLISSEAATGEYARELTELSRKDIKRLLEKEGK